MPSIIRRLDGTDYPSFPDGTLAIHNAYLGDSNAFGWDATMRADLQTFSTSSPNVVAASAPYNVTNNLWYWNWQNHADQNLIGTVSPQRNSARTYTASTNYVVVSADGGFDNGGVGVGDAVGPDWSLAASNSSQYEALLHTDRSLYNAPDAQYVLWTKHGISGATVHNGNGSVASLHPEATAATPIFGNWQSNFTSGARFIVRDFGGGLDHEFFDTLYLVLTGAEANSAAGFEDAPFSFAGNLNRTIQAVADEVGIAPGRMNVVCTEPGGGPYGIDRSQYLRGEGLEMAKRANPQVRWVNIDDLPRSGDVHFTADGYVELGKRLSRARFGDESAIIHELTIVA